MTAAGAIRTALERVPLHSPEEARLPTSAGGPPSSAGFYAWWADPGCLPGYVTQTPHPAEPVELLYVGISPNSPRSGSNLRKRLRQHTGAKAGSSTFRLDLAALLFEREGWHPIWTDRAQLRDGDLAALGAWQRKYLRVQWHAVEAPWSGIEAEVVRLMNPPLNREHNQTHPYYEEMGDARDRFRAAARLNPAS